MCFFVFLTGCQNDDFTGTPEVEQQETTTVPGSSSVVNHQQMSQNQDLLAILTKISSQAKARGVDIPTAQYSFTVDTSFANYYENDKYHSYTFLVTSNPENKTGNMQNFLVSSNPAGSYDTFLVDFGFTEEEFNTNSERELNDSQTIYTPLHISSLNPPVDNDPKSPLLAPVICIDILVWDDELYCADYASHSNACGGWVLVSTDCVFTSAGGSGGVKGGNPDNSSPNNGYPGGYHQGGTSNGDGNGDGDPGNSITVVPLPNKAVLLYNFTPTNQQQADDFQDLLDNNNFDENLLNKLSGLYNSNIDYPG